MGGRLILAALENGLMWLSPQHPQQICDILQATASPLRCQPLQLGLGLSQSRRVEQVAQRGPLTTSEKLGQQGGVQRQGGSTPLGQRRVTFIEELGYVAEHEAAGEG